MEYTKDGAASKRQHYLQRAKQTGKTVDFDDEDLPENVAYFHNLFFELWDSYRGLTYLNIWLWQQIYKIELSYDVIEMFKRIANKANEFVKERNKAKEK